MGKAIEIQSPNKWTKKDGYMTVFLAGSIGLPDSGGKAINWQKELIEKLKDEPIVFLNPRRNDWDSSWVQSINNEQFRTQVEWELNSMECSDIVVMVFDPNTMSPISLLELGLHSKSGTLVVMCPEGFWRKGNVDIVCARYNIVQVNNLDELVNYIHKEL